MRVVGLNLSFTDKMLKSFSFEAVEDYFGPSTQQGIVFLRSKFEFDSAVLVLR